MHKKSSHQNVSLCINRHNGDLCVSRHFSKSTQKRQSQKCRLRRSLLYILPPCLPPGRWKGGRAEGGGQTSRGGRVGGRREGTRVKWRAGGQGAREEGAGGGGGERREGEGGHAGRMEGGRGRKEGAGGGRRKFCLRAELIKCIDPNEGEALKRGRVWGRREGGKGGAEGNFTWGRNWSNVLIPMKVRHWKGGGAEGRQKILPKGQNWSNVLIPMKVRHWGGGPPSNLGVWRPLPPLFHCLWGWAGGRIYRLIISVSWLSTTETQAPVTSHFRWPG